MPYRTQLTLLAVLALAMGCAGGTEEETGSVEGRGEVESSHRIDRSILDDPGRPEVEQDLDEARKPLEFYEWLGVRPGMTVADMWPGGGYNTHILSLLMGTEGRVVAVWHWYGTDAFGPTLNLRPRFQERADELGLHNVIMTAEFSDVPDDSIDIALSVRNYHDLWMKDDWDPLDFVREMYRFVKPGGFVGIVEVATLHEGFHSETHRLNEQVVVADFTSVGFELVDRSDMLANPNDDHSTPGYPDRHLTDQYVLKFRKPQS